MGLKYLKADKISELEAEIENNRGSYIKREILANENDYLESSIAYKKIELILKENKKSNDFENVQILYSAYKHLTPLEASDERIWVGLTHTKEVMDYVVNRWSINEDSKIGTFKDRFFGKPMRNSLSRLWWYGYTTYNENLENPWELTEILSNNQDLAVGIMERGYSNNKEFVQLFLMAIKEWLDEGNKMPKTDNIRLVLKGVQRISAITLVDLLCIDDFTEIIKKYG